MTDWLSFSPRTKSIALLVATLLLGVVVGALLNAWWAHERFERIRRLRTPGGFEQIVTRTVQPTSPKQRQEIEAVVGRTAQRLDSLRTRHWREVRRLVDTMRTDLEPVLTEEQLSALDRRIEMHRRRPGPPGPGLRGPGPGRPRPPGPPPALRDQRPE
jgi:hypothetical protein